MAAAARARHWPFMRMNIAMNGLAADEYESSVVVNIELNRHAERTMASSWTSRQRLTALEEVHRMVATGGRVATAGFALTVMALLLPGLAYAAAVLSQTAAQSVAVARPVTAHQSAAAARPVPAGRSVTAALHGPGTGGCHGTGYRVIPARGDISDLAGTEGGHIWWRASSRSQIMCTGTVRMWVRYPEREYARWLVVIYDHHALRHFIGARNFTLRAGWYYWDFPVYGEFQGTDSLCLTTQFGTGRDLRAATSCAPIG
jgi:hypothetical protein